MHLLYVPQSPLGIRHLLVTKTPTLINLKMKHTKMGLLMTSFKPGDPQRIMVSRYSVFDTVARATAKFRLQG